jgi:hypothetical protein
VSGGWTKIFFAANGVAATTTLIDVNNLVMQSDCSAADHEPEFRTTINNSVIRATEITSTDTPDYSSEDDLDIGEVFDEADGLTDDQSIWDVVYGNTVGQMVKVNVTVDDGTDNLFNSTDCAVIGGYLAL